MAKITIERDDGLVYTINALDWLIWDRDSVVEQLASMIGDEKYNELPSELVDKVVWLVTDRLKDSEYFVSEMDEFIDIVKESALEAGIEI